MRAYRSEDEGRRVQKVQEKESRQVNCASYCRDSSVKEQERVIMPDLRSNEGIITQVFLKYLSFAGGILIALVSLRLFFGSIWPEHKQAPDPTPATAVEVGEQLVIDQELPPVTSPNNFAKRKDPDPEQILESTITEKEEAINPYAPSDIGMIKPRKKVLKVPEVKGICADNLDVLESAKTLWYLDTDSASSEAPSWQDLVPEYLQEMPVCPGGGVYAIGNSYHEASCSRCGKARNPALYSADETAVNGVFAKVEGRYFICHHCRAEIDKKELERSVRKGRASCPFCNEVIK